MESKNNFESLSKGSGFKLKNLEGELVKNFDSDNGNLPIPDWKSFNIKNIADIQVGSEKKILLKNEKEDGNGKFIEINGRRYYEFNGEGVPGNSFYLHRRGSLFLGDRLGGLAIREGVSFRCLHDSEDNFILEQRGTRYSGGAMHLQQLYKSENFSSGGIYTIGNMGKRVRITKNLVEKYLDGTISDASRIIIENAMRLDPEFFDYIENFEK